MKRILLTLILILTSVLLSSAQGTSTGVQGAFNPVASDTGSFGFDSVVVAYTAGDKIGPTTMFALPNAGKNKSGAGGSVAYVKVVLDSANAVGAVLASIYYDSLGMSYFVNNAAYSPTATMRRKCLGTAKVLFTTEGTASGVSSIGEVNCLIPYACMVGTTNLYVEFSDVVAFTPKKSGTFSWEIRYVRY